MEIELLKLSKILSLFFGDDYRIEKLKSSLPLIYEKSFSLFSLNAINGSLTFTLVVPNNDLVPIDYIFSLSRMLFNEGKRPLTIVFGKISSYKKSLKVNLIPFLSDDGDSLLTSIEASGSSPNVDESSALAQYTKGTQLVLKFYLFSERVFYTTRDIASKVNISFASVSRANSVLFSLGLLNKKGVNSGAKFSLSSARGSFSKLDSKLILPYRNKTMVLLDDEYIDSLKGKYLYSGDTALSSYTDLESDDMRIEFATNSKQYGTLIKELASSRLGRGPSRMVEFQEYRYDPSVFASNGCIDLLDLYIMERKRSSGADHRLHKALEEVKRRIINYGE